MSYSVPVKEQKRALVSEASLGRDFESVKSDSESLPSVLYENVMEKEESVLEWLEQIVSQTYFSSDGYYGAHDIVSVNGASA